MSSTWADLLLLSCCDGRPIDAATARRNLSEFENEQYEQTYKNVAKIVLQ